LRQITFQKDFRLFLDESDIRCAFDQRPPLVILGNLICPTDNVMVGTIEIHPVKIDGVGKAGELYEIKLIGKLTISPVDQRQPRGMDIVGAMTMQERQKLIRRNNSAVAGEKVDALSKFVNKDEHVIGRDRIGVAGHLPRKKTVPSKASAPIFGNHSMNLDGKPPLSGFLVQHRVL